MMIIGSDNSAIYRKAGAQLFEYDPIKNPAQVDEDGKFDVWPDSSRANLPISARDAELGDPITRHKFNNNLDDEQEFFDGEFAGKAWQPIAPGGKNALYFDQDRCIEVPGEAVETVEDEITIVFQCVGSSRWPAQTIGFNGTNGVDSNRMVQAYLPWDSTIFWDAGSAAAYDLITQSAGSPINFSRTHDRWVFTKNAVTGIMNIYRNGVLFQTATEIGRAHV